MRFADPPHIAVEHAGTTYPVALRRNASARKLTLRIATATGQAVMTLPTSTDLAVADRFARSHGGWIAARIAKVPVRQDPVGGTLIPIRGVDHAVSHVSPVRGPTVASTAADGSPVLEVRGDPAAIRSRIREYLAREAKRDLDAAVMRHCAALGRRATRIAVKDTVSRWGSCTAKGELSFSWRLILAPPFVLDYLAAHEVGHLAEMNHSNRFWKIVKGLCPRTDEAESWLKRNGAGLHRQI